MDEFKELKNEVIDNTQLYYQLNLINFYKLPYESQHFKGLYNHIEFIKTALGDSFKILEIKQRWNYLAFIIGHNKFKFIPCKIYLYMHYHIHDKLYVLITNIHKKDKHLLITEETTYKEFKRFFT